MKRLARMVEGVHDSPLKDGEQQIRPSSLVLKGINPGPSWPVFTPLSSRHCHSDSMPVFAALNPTGRRPTVVGGTVTMLTSAALLLLVLHLSVQLIQ